MSKFNLYIIWGIHLRRKKELIGKATKLYTLGLTVEKRRNKLRQLVDKKAPYESSQMRIAVDEFMAMANEWKRLEQEYLAYQAMVTGSEGIA